MQDTPQNPNPNEPEEQPEDRLDRLMNAKQQADDDAEKWSEIENLGRPVPSADRPDPHGTSPLSLDDEPPLQEGDTPAGSRTPPEGLPRIDPSLIPRMEDIEKARQEEPESPSASPETPREPVPPIKPQRKSPSFPHPTDPVPGAGVVHPTDTPPPDKTDKDLPFEVTPPSQATPIRAESDFESPASKLEDVRLDSSGMPLPKSVPFEDDQATIPGRSAFRDELPGQATERTQPHGYDRPDFSGELTQRNVPVSGRAGQVGSAPPPPRREPIQPRPVQPPAAQVVGPVRSSRHSEVRKPRRRKIRITGRAILQLVVLGLVGGLVMTILGAGGAAIYYSQVTAPSFQGITNIEDLQERALQFETTRIRDREGSVLYQINDPQGGLRDYVPLEEISPYVIFATVATEERDFFTNPGFSIPAIIRAVIQNIQEGEAVSGASTITQQLTRALLLPEEERYERSVRRKIKEIFLAAELGRRFSKEEIMELYLNQAYYGNLSYGTEAAAQTYFDKSARDLTMAEASFLVGLPQAPAVWDPVRIDPETNQSVAVERQRQVLSLMLEAGCIDIGNTSLELPCVTGQDVQNAGPELAAIANRTYLPPQIQARYPHWVVYVQQLLEADPAIGPAIYTSGFDVYTTLDPRIQDVAEAQVDATLAGLTDRNVGNASVVVVDIETGAILAMVGSRDFDDETIDGQVNVALSPQQPGSSIKPFTYMTAFENGWNPATIIWDVPIEYEIPGFGIYEPVNYDGVFRGPVSVRFAVANSLNVPAVQTLDYVGIPDLLNLLNRFGVESLGDETNPQQFGLSLTLGAGEVTLLEWTNAYATLANGGMYHPTFAIERIEVNGQVLEGYPYVVPEGEQAIDAAHAFLMQSIMSDYEARVPSFGRDTPLSPPGYVAAAKTGTTNDFRDNWTMGYTTRLAVGVWVGNTDNSPMINVTGVTGAGPIWRGVMDAAQVWYPSGPFPQPSTVIQTTVCRDDGAIPSPYCLEHSEVITEFFKADEPPPKENEGLYRQLRVDTFNNLIANDNCTAFVEERLYLVIPNPSQLIDVSATAREWITGSDRGRNWATQRGISLENFSELVPPEEECTPDTPQPVIEIAQPGLGTVQEGLLLVIGTAQAPNFAYYTVDFGLGPNPQGWGEVQGRTPSQVENNALAQFDLAPFAGQEITLRLTVFDQGGRSAETRVTFRVADATPTPTPTPIPTDQPTLTPSPVTPTATSPATATPGVPTATQEPPSPTP